MKDISGREFKEDDVIVYFVRSSGGMYNSYGRIEKIEEKRIIVVQDRYTWSKTLEKYIHLFSVKRTYHYKPYALIVTEGQVPEPYKLIIYGG
jgi:hypothetical protein